MDKRMVDFIRALRAAGVRISLAESQDAMYGTDRLGVQQMAQFKSTLKTTLVKERRDQTIFEYFFPLFFTANQPPMQNIPDNLSPQERQMLEQALRSLAGQMQALRDLMNQLLDGQNFNQDQLNEMGQQAGLDSADDMGQRMWMERRMRTAAQLQQLQQMIEALIEQLKEMGMDEQRAEQLREMMQQNMDGFSEQISNHVGLSLAERMAAEDRPPRRDVLDIPLQRLGEDDVEQIRDEIRRLAAKLRSRVALRQRRSKDGEIDPRRTMRAAMKTYNVPLELRHENL